MEQTENKVYPVHRLKDIKLIAFLWIQEGIELTNVARTTDDHNKSQYIFELTNKTEIPLKQWILDYQNDKIPVSIHKYNKRLDDIKDIIHGDITGENK